MSKLIKTSLVDRPCTSISSLAKQQKKSVPQRVRLGSKKIPRFGFLNFALLTRIQNTALLEVIFRKSLELIHFHLPIL